MKKRTNQDMSPIPPQEDYYADYYPQGYPPQDEYSSAEDVQPALETRWSSEEERERYYARKDAYYARRDAYYARRDAYYARREREEPEEPEEYEPEEYEPEEYEPRKRAARSGRRRKKRPERPESPYAPEDEEEPKRLRRRFRRQGRRRKRRFFRRLIVLLFAATAVLLLLGTAPVRNPDKLPREAGHSTILLAGTDRGGYRTDTILLVSLERGEPVRLLSIPRDTYVADYTTHKINAVYGAVGGGTAGMELLMREIGNVIGFEPDGYVLMDMGVVVRAVDLLGGVDYNVPQDMDYDDDAQDLHIHLTAGQQHLDGQQVIELLRFRSGYADADMGRTEVQRDFLRTALKQWISFSNVLKLPDLLKLYRGEGVTGSLTFRNLMWVVRVLVKADLTSTVTDDVLPGWADMVDGSSVYMVERTGVAKFVREYNPYAVTEEG